MMKPGDLILLNSTNWSPGTLAILLEVLDVGRDGPGMETLATVMIKDTIRCVYLHECEEIRDETG